MKNYLSVTFLSLMALMLSTVVYAQERLNLNLGYSINQPGSEFKQVVNNTSFRGFTGGVTYDLNEKLGIGLGVSYSDFYEKKPRQVYQTNEGAISAVLSNSIQILPVVAKVKYSFLGEGSITPYIGAGAGMNMINFDQYYGEFNASKVAVKPAITGEAGLKIPLGATKRSGLNIGAHYMYLPFNYNGVKNLNSYGAHVGVFFPLR